MKSNRISHRVTNFEMACEEKKEYDKSYSNNLSYGYYSTYKEAGFLPKEWYKHLLDLKKDIPDDLDASTIEYREYKRRFHSKISYSKYISNRDNGKLPKKWYIFLLKCEEQIPDNFNYAYIEYFEYCILFEDNITFYEYYEKKDNAELPVEWYKCLIQLQESIEELEQAAIF